MKFKKIIVQFIILFLSFDVLPIFFIMKEDYKNPPLFLIFGVFPAVSLIAGLYTGIKNGFFTFSIFVPVLCIIPSALFYFSGGKIAFAVFYVLIYVIAMALGSLIYRSNPKNKGD